MTLVNAIASLVNTKQSKSKSDDKFLKCFKSSLNTVELAGGKNLFCPVYLMEKAGTTPDTQEIKKEEEKTKSAFPLTNTDNKRYSGINERLE